MVKLNAVIIPVGDDPRFVKSRVVHIAPGNGVAYLVPMEYQALPEPVAMKDIESAGNDGRIRFATEAPSASKRNSESLPARYSAIRDAAWERIAPLVELKTRRFMFDRSVRGGLIARRSKSCKVQPTQLYRDLYRFFRGGMVKDALYPEYRSVLVGSLQPDGQQKRGRKPSDVRKGLRENSPAVTAYKRKEIIRTILKEVKEGSTQDDIFNKVIDLCYSSEIQQRGLTTYYVHLPLEQQLTRAQFSRIFKRANEGNTLSKRMMGQKTWDSTCQAALGSTRASVDGPGRRYEFDWTGTRVELVAEDHPDEKIGTAIIYFVVDVWSGMIAGFFVTLAGASWDSASLALFNAISSKVDFCKHYGRTIAHEEWPVEGVPFDMAGDRGPEVVSEASTAAIGSLFIDFQTTRPYKGRDKAIVEATNGVFKKQLFRRLSGYRPKMGKRGDRNPRKSACLTLFDLTQIVIIEVLRYNKRSLPLAAVPSLARKAGIPRTPLSLWKWGLPNCTGTLRAEDPDKLFAKLLPELDGAITANGLKVGKFRYTAPELEKADVFSTARRRGRQDPVKVRVDPARPEIAMLPRKGARGFIRCTRIDDEHHYERYRFEDAALEAKSHSAKRRDLDQNAAQSRSDARAEQAGIERRAKARVKNAGISGAGGGRNTIRKNREKERSISSERQHAFVQQQAFAGARKNGSGARGTEAILTSINERMTRTIASAVRGH